MLTCSADTCSCSVSVKALGSGKELAPWEIHSYLCRVMYNRRNKFDPLWNSLVVAGCKGGRQFLAMVGRRRLNPV